MAGLETSRLLHPLSMSDICSPGGSSTSALTISSIIQPELPLTVCAITAMTISGTILRSHLQVGENRLLDPLIVDLITLVFVHRAEGYSNSLEATLIVIGSIRNREPPPPYMRL